MKNLIEQYKAQAKKLNKTIVMPEGNEPRVIRAAAICTQEKLAKIITDGNLEEKVNICRENFPKKIAEKLLQKVCGFNEKESKFIIEN